MSRPQRRAAWIWGGLCLLGLAAAFTIRWAGGWGRPAPAAARSDSDGRLGADSDSLAAAARHVRILQDAADRTREQLSANQSAISARRDQVASLDEMLASGSLTDSPAFLRDDTTVRALQKIIREAADAAGPEAADGRLSTAATIARERLRRKLQLLRDQAVQETSDLEHRAETLRQRLHAETDELQRVQRQVQRQLQGRSDVGSAWAP